MTSARFTTLTIKASIISKSRCLITQSLEPFYLSLRARYATQPSRVATLS